MTDNRIDTVPDSFSGAFAGNYLGNPAVVQGLTSEYLSTFEALLRRRSADEITAEDFKDQLSEMVHHYGDIFSGRVAAYSIIQGYHDHTLGYKLMADLGPFWGANRARWNDDPVCTLFEWAAVMYANNLKTADDDEVLLGVMFKPTHQYFVQVLLGIEARVVS